MGVRRVAAAQAFDSKKINYCGDCCGGELVPGRPRASLLFYSLFLIFVLAILAPARSPRAPLQPLSRSRRLRGFRGRVEEACGGIACRSNAGEGAASAREVSLLQTAQQRQATNRLLGLLFIYRRQHSKPGSVLNSADRPQINSLTATGLTGLRRRGSTKLLDKGYR